MLGIDGHVERAAAEAAAPVAGILAWSTASTKRANIAMSNNKRQRRMGDVIDESNREEEGKTEGEGWESGHPQGSNLFASVWFHLLGAFNRY